MSKSVTGLVLVLACASVALGIGRLSFVRTIELKPYDAPGLEDTVNIPAQIGTGPTAIPGKVIIRNRFADFPGWFVFHCHILGHEDGGMMLTVQVLKPGEQPSPPPHEKDLTAHNMHNMTDVTEQ